jgi:hypothetical protein
MASFTSPSSRSSGYKILASDWNLLVSDIIYLGSGDASAGRPAVMAVSTDTNGLTQDTWIGPITFTSADEYDTDSMHNPSSNSARLVANTAGLYLITAELYADAHTQAEPIHLMLRKNAGASATGGTFIAQSTTVFSTNTASSIPTGLQLQTMVRLAATDYVSLFVMSEASGESLIGTTVNHRFGMIWQTA